MNASPLKWFTRHRHCQLDTRHASCWIDYTFSTWGLGPIVEVDSCRGDAYFVNYIDVSFGFHIGPLTLGASFNG